MQKTSMYSTLLSRDRKNMTARDGILLIFLCLGIGQLSPQFGVDLLSKLHTKTLEKTKKSTGENSKNPTETAPRNCRFLSLVVVERVQIFRLKFQTC